MTKCCLIAAVGEHHTNSSKSAFRCDAVPALTAIPASLCAQAADPGPKLKPFKCPRSVVLCNDTSSPTSHKGLCRCTQPGWDAQLRRLSLFAICAEQQKSHKTAASSRKCAERSAVGEGGGYLAHRVAGKRCKLRVNCAPSPWDVAQAAAFFTSSVLLGIQCGRNQDTTRCVSAMGATTMPIIEPPSRWKVQTVRLPAIVSRSTFRFTTGHRQLGIRKLSTSSSVLFLVNAVQGSPPARSLSVVVSAPPPSLSALSRVC